MPQWKNFNNGRTTHQLFIFWKLEISFYLKYQRRVVAFCRDWNLRSSPATRYAQPLAPYHQTRNSVPWGVSSAWGTGRRHKLPNRGYTMGAVKFDQPWDSPLKKLIVDSCVGGHCAEELCIYRDEHAAILCGDSANLLQNNQSWLSWKRLYGLRLCSRKIWPSSLFPAEAAALNFLATD